MSHKAVDGDTGETATIDDRAPLPHCFIVRLDDDLLEVVLRHQNILARGLKRDVSRAAAVREVLRRALPKRHKPKPAREQLTLFGVPLKRDPLVAIEAQRVAGNAAQKLLTTPSRERKT